MKKWNPIQFSKQLYTIRLNSIGPKNYTCRAFLKFKDFLHILNRTRCPIFVTVDAYSIVCLIIAFNSRVSFDQEAETIFIFRNTAILCVSFVHRFSTCWSKVSWLSIVNRNSLCELTCSSSVKLLCNSRVDCSIFLG